MANWKNCVLYGQLTAHQNKYGGRNACIELNLKVFDNLKKEKNPCWIHNDWVVLRLLFSSISIEILRIENVFWMEKDRGYRWVSFILWITFHKMCNFCPAMVVERFSNWLLLRLDSLKIEELRKSEAKLKFLTCHCDHIPQCTLHVIRFLFFFSFFFVHLHLETDEDLIRNAEIKRRLIGELSLAVKEVCIPNNLNLRLLSMQNIVIQKLG